MRCRLPRSDERDGHTSEHLPDEVWSFRGRSENRRLSLRNRHPDRTSAAAGAPSSVRSAGGDEDRLQHRRRSAAKRQRHWWRSDLPSRRRIARYACREPRMATVIAGIRATPGTGMGRRLSPFRCRRTETPDLRPAAVWWNSTRPSRNVTTERVPSPFSAALAPLDLFYAM